jgi:D-glycero-alpha-D-manno-heptose-7-phosphate kinase
MSIADILQFRLGSSSSFTVGLLHALHAFKANSGPPNNSPESCEIEIEVRAHRKTGPPRRFGGFNLFNSILTIRSVGTIICKRETLQRLEENILVFYTGIHAVLPPFQTPAGRLRGEEKAKVLCQMVDLARQFKAQLGVIP